MPKTARIDEIEIDGEFVQIYFGDGNVEPTWTIEDPPIKYMQQSELLNMMNIPTTEYSQELDSRSNTQLYIDDILTNFNNRSVAQLGIAQDRIDELGGYNNGKLEFDDNAIEGLLQITIEWLKVINSNFNDLLGLVSVNNFLVSMMGATGSKKVTGVSEDYVTRNQVEAIIEVETKPSMIDNIFTTAGVWSVGGMAAELFGKVGKAALPFKLGAVALHVLDDIDIGSESSSGMSGVNDEDIYEVEPSFWSKLLTALFDEFLGEPVDVYGAELTPEMKKQYAKNVPNSMQSSVDSQPLVAMSGVKDENTYAEEQSGLSKIITTIIDIFGPELQTVEGAEKHKARNKYTDTPNMYSRNMLNNTYENKTNTNTNESQDLYNNMYNSKNYAPQKIEHTYDIPITNYITVNEAEKNDYDEFARKIKREIVNEILGLKAVMV